MSTSDPPPADEPDTDPAGTGWPDLSPEEATELRAAFDEAEENHRKGVPGIPLDEVLPRYRRAG